MKRTILPSDRLLLFAVRWPSGDAVLEKKLLLVSLLVELRYFNSYQIKCNAF